jgi:hypothetical protein
MDMTKTLLAMAMPATFPIDAHPSLPTSPAHATVPNASPMIA